MANALSELMYQYMIQLDLKNFFIQLLNYYFPYGLFWWMTGFIFALVVHTKSKNLAYAGAAGSAYFIILSQTGLVVNAFAVEYMMKFGMIVGAISGYYIYRAIRR